MMSRIDLVIALVAMCAALRGTGETSSPRGPLRGAERVLLLGDSITHAVGYTVDLETHFVLRDGEAAPTFLNAGLPSETVSGLSEPGHAGGAFARPDLHARLGRLLGETKPDLVIACYGMNDGIYLPFDVERFAAFQRGIERLHNAVIGRKAKIIHVTPPTFDDARSGNHGYNEVLHRYAQWLLNQREARGWQVLDVHGPMTNYLETKRKQNAAFYLAEDAVHPSTQGHWIIAQQILAQLGAADAAGFHTPDEMLASHANGPAIRRLVHDRQVLLRDSILTHVGHERPGLPPGKPWSEATMQARTFTQEIHGLLRKSAK